MSSDNRRYNTRRGRVKKPNPALYVGYVEDGETVEMIMKKFEALKHIQGHEKKCQEERLEQMSSAKRKEELSDDEDVTMLDENVDSNIQLSEEALVNLFQQTSSFSVQSAKSNNLALFQRPEISKDGFIVALEEVNVEDILAEMTDYNLGDCDEFYNYQGMSADDFFEDPATKKKKGTKGRGSKSSSSKRGGAPGRAATDLFRFDFGLSVGGVDDAVVRKRRPPSDEYYTKIPPHPLPRSWAHCVRPLQGRDEVAPGDCTKIHGDLFHLNADILPEREYVACLLNPVWDCQSEMNKGKFTTEHFEKLRLDGLVQRGLLFIWVPKELTYEVTLLCEKQMFRFVESMTWVKKHVNNRIVQRPSRYFNCSKSNLLIFRKVRSMKGVDYFRLDLRHQRTSDSHFGYVRFDPDTGLEMKPDEYVMGLIETLLPEQVHIEENPFGAQRYLYLGAPNCTPRRQHWTFVTQS